MTTTIRVHDAEPSVREHGRPDPPTRPHGTVAVCLDGSPCAECALPHAVALAHALGAPITLLHVLEGAGGESRADAFEWAMRRREAQSYLDRMAAEHRADGALLPTQMMEGSAAEAICDWGWSHDVETTCLCTHGAGGSPAWTLGATARKLLERAPGSLLLVPSGEASARGPARYRRILVPLDGSHRAESVLPLATKIAAAHGAEVLLVHVVPMPELTEIGPLSAEDLELRESVVRRNERVATEYLDRLRALHATSGARLLVSVQRGADVRDRLGRLVTESGADFVVLAAHGRSERCDAPVGSVALHLIRNARIPLWIVRPRPASPLRRDAAAHREENRLPSQAAP